jgi:PAS domain S-box-containing protein
MGAKTVLLVEDEAIIALAEAAAIRRAGYDALIVGSGEDAVGETLGNTAISLVLMDINLGAGIDGTEAARRILAERNVPIVFLTSHSEREMVEKVRGITRYGYVIKNSGDFVLQASIEMAFELFEALERLKDKEAALAQEQYLLHALLDGSTDYIYFKDRESRFIRASAALAGSFGIGDPADLIGKTDFELFSEEHARQAFEDEQAIIRTGEPISKEEKETRSGRPDAWVLTNKMPLRDRLGSIVGIFGISMDITKRKLAEERADYHLRLYDTLSKINRAIVYAGQRGELFEKICETIVVAGKFRTAWIGLLDESRGVLDRMARAGQEGDLSRSDMDNYSVEAQARSPIGTAIRTGKVVLYEDPTNPDRAKRRTVDHRSSAAIPFGVKGAGIGVLNISATESGYFTQEERWMLEEIGADISFALEKMNLEIERKRPDEDKTEEADTR